MAQARLPVPGSDKGTWGDILNQFLAQAHNSDGSLKNSGVIADKIAKSGDTMSGSLAMTSNKITGLADGTSSTDATNVGQLSAAIADAETDLATVGTEITDLPTALRNDAVWDPTYTNNQNYAPIVQNGVAKKMPLELITSMGPSAAVVITGTSHTWAPGECTLLCNNSSPLTITFPTFGSAPGAHIAVRIIRIGAGTVTIAAGSSATVNRASGLPATLRAQYSVAYVHPYLYFSGNSFYVASGDLG